MGLTCSMLLRDPAVKHCQVGYRVWFSLFWLYAKTKLEPVAVLLQDCELQLMIMFMLAHLCQLYLLPEPVRVLATYLIGISWVALPI